MSYVGEILSLFPKAAGIVFGLCAVTAIPLNIYSSSVAKQCPANIDTNGGLWEFGPDYVEFCQANRITSFALQPIIAVYNFKYWARVVNGTVTGGVPGYKRGDPKPSNLWRYMPDPL